MGGPPDGAGYKFHAGMAPKNGRPERTDAPKRARCRNHTSRWQSGWTHPAGLQRGGGLPTESSGGVPPRTIGATTVRPGALNGAASANPTDRWFTGEGGGQHQPGIAPVGLEDRRRLDRRALDRDTAHAPPHSIPLLCVAAAEARPRPASWGSRHRKGTGIRREVYRQHPTG